MHVTMIKVGMKWLAKQVAVEVHNGCLIVGVEETTNSNGTELLAVWLGRSIEGEEFSILILVALIDSIVSARRVLRPHKNREEEEQN